ncbi:MAG: hypothetical protein K2G23_10540, partial [Muribaculaceae bacterium]|nr:hypothetical protein [Muribaculaceae bacterium]
AKLNPDATSRNLEKAKDLRKDLENLQNSLDNAEERASALAVALNDLTELSAEEKELKEISLKANEEADRLRNLSEEARQRYATMHLSVEENFSLLRKRLAHEDADTCPLCGQPKEWHDTEEEMQTAFSGILSPLKEECDMLQKRSTEAETESKLQSKKYNQLTGTIKSLQTNAANLRRQYDKAKKSLVSDLDSLNAGIPQLIDIVAIKGYDPENDNASGRPFDEIREKIKLNSDANDKTIETLTLKKREADSIQNEINRQTAECRPLEETASKAAERKATAATNMAVNENNIKNLEKAIKDLEP